MLAQERKFSLLMICFFVLILIFIVFANLLFTDQKIQQQAIENIYLEEEGN